MSSSCSVSMWNVKKNLRNFPRPGSLGRRPCEGGAAAAAQRARGARDGVAEQRPLARSLLRLSRSAVCAGCASGEGASVAARDARFY